MTIRLSIRLGGFLLLAVGWAAAQVPATYAYYDHVIFDNSLEKDGYFYSGGRASEPSTLKLVDGRVPVETKLFHSPPNALRLEWNASPEGGWEAGIAVVMFRDRGPELHGSELTFWCYSPEGISGSELPSVRLQDEDRGFSATLPLEKYVRQIPAKQWVEVRIPLEKMESASIHAVDVHRVRRVVFLQDKSHGAHTMIVDDFKIDDPEQSERLAAPANVKAKGYERHVDVSWDPVPGSSVQGYVIYRAMGDGVFHPVGTEPADLGPEMFDVRLGRGAPFKIGEESYAFARLLSDGYTAVYLPSALVFHPPLRRDTIENEAQNSITYWLLLFAEFPDQRLNLVRFILRRLRRKPLDWDRNPRQPGEVVTSGWRVLAKASLKGLWLFIRTPKEKRK